MPFDLHNWVFVFIRTGGFLLMLPIFSAANIPVRLRVGLAAMVAFMISPGLPALALQDLNWPLLIGLIAKEVGVGLTLGFVTRMVFYAVDLAGALVATEMGLNLSISFNPAAGMQSQAPGMIFFYLAAILLLTLDLHHWLIAAFHRSYDVLPIGGASLRPGLLTAVVGYSQGIWASALYIAAPLIAVSFVITLVFGVLSRAVPQMNVFSESFAFRTLAGLAVFGLTIQMMAQHISNYLRRLPEDLLRVAQLMGG
ncbi:MAG: flagellar biosynthetic protein FliR [Verrucomicrobia bacterium]|nr:flagellar biosynthetic protein FliR [Verrucomicrobiota bacterium]